jgi:hypothetical protein
LNFLSGRVNSFPGEAAKASWEESWGALVSQGYMQAGVLFVVLEVDAKASNSFQNTEGAARG